MSSEDVSEPPVKRRRLSNDVGSMNSAATSTASMPGMLATNSDILEAKRQYDVGIREFINGHVSPFSATLKKRYTDFLVNEILPNNEVVHLRNLNVQKVAAPENQNDLDEEIAAVSATTSGPQSTNELPEAVPVSQNGLDNVLPEVAESDRAKLVDYFDEASVVELLNLYQSIRTRPGKKPGDHPVVRTNFTTDRSIRSQIHQSIREIFRSSIDSSTDHDGVLVLSAAKPVNKGKQSNGKSVLQFKNQRPGKLGWLDRGGEYLHFTLFKENKDTMEVVSWLTRQLKCNPKNFQFAGTKDRRAVTTQRCSAYRIDVHRLQAQNRTLRGSKVGDFEYRPHGLELGDLAGNQFVITLRNFQPQDSRTDEQDVQSLRNTMRQRMQSLRDYGYLNYFGLQRFGTFTVRTDVIGRDILKGDFQAACDDILSFSEDAAEAAKQDSSSKIGQDDKDRALAIQKWRQDRRVNIALDVLPRKFTAEAQLIRYLSKNPSDPFGALLTIQRNLRLMYVHAYQSYVWNLALSHRTRSYGNKVVKGDLVLINEHKEKMSGAVADQEMSVDADGEQIIIPASHDRAAQEDDVFERARPLSEAEASSGDYTIFDIVLPLPGYDIVYPENETGTFYRTFMTSIEGGELDPNNMRRKQREFSLSGSYRKIVERIGEDFEVWVHKYDKDEEQFVKTDLELLDRATDQDNEVGDNGIDKGSDPNNEGDKTAVVLKFQLGSSQYATMALRELSGNGIEQHKPDFMGGR